MIGSHCHLESELARNPDIYHERQKRTNQHRLVRSTVFNFDIGLGPAMSSRGSDSICGFLFCWLFFLHFCQLDIVYWASVSLHTDAGIAICERGAQRQGDGSPNALTA